MRRASTPFRQISGCGKTIRESQNNKINPEKMAL
jgi:hypothetical protein